MQPSQIQIIKEKLAFGNIPTNKYHISEEDLRQKCWWCGSVVVGFNKVTGRDMKPYKKHFCRPECYHQFQDAVKADDEDHERQIEGKLIIA